MKDQPKKRIRENYKCKDCDGIFSALRDNVRRNGYYRCIECGRKAASKKRKGVPVKHGDAIKSSPFNGLYNVYRSMRYRCESSHPNYGGRGIKVCDEWVRSYEKFKAWAFKSGYNKGLTIDRKNNNSGYSPDNCRWANMCVQIANQRKRKTNTSGYTGVRYSKNERKWLVTITINYNDVHLGYFNTPVCGAIKREEYIIKNNLPHRRNFQMAEYMTEKQRHYLSVGIPITNPDDLKLLQYEELK